ncbi:inosine monophosphate dehydrogenase [Setomelanomma holmii]|uniref:Inosine monophosphate dehydrogenase n=1 Tax=Setomelanomma holmii TaxID=210430 RepID=A0A9P4H8N9_9PLEO|nr:inosine monophosphate dehydrogenase [Setomelanomma holmii]
MTITGPIVTPLTTLLGIKHPIILGGMAGVSSGLLAASVSNTGGLGVVGGVGCTPNHLQDLLSQMKRHLSHPSIPFGISLSLNHEIHAGPEKVDVNDTDLIDIVVQARSKLMVSSLGHPSREIVERLHGAGILVMSLVGHPKHAISALEAGVDIICTQGYESRGHTCDIAGQILLQAITDIVRERSKLLPNRSPIHVVAGGGIATGRALASALTQGAGAVMISTRFAASVEAEGGDAMKEAILSCSLTDTERTSIFTGRMLRVRSSEYIRSWHSRANEVEELRKQGIVPAVRDFKEGKQVEIPFLMGQSAGLIKEIKTSEQIVHDLIKETVESLSLVGTYYRERSRL